MKEFYPFFVDYIPLIISNVIVIAFFLFFQKNTKKVKTSYKSKIAELESRSLRAQMNPHFIFNAINGVQSIMLLKGEVESNRYIDLLDDLMATVNHNPMGLNPIEMAAFFHHQMVWIHPFFDGNGRTARLAMNLILIRAGFPPAIILRQDRKKYYTALNSANQGNYQKLMLLMAQALERSLNIYLSILPDAEEEYMEISNLVKEPDFPYGQEYISLLARQGKIDAHKEGKNWHTSKAAVTNYILNRKRKRHLQ